MYYFYGLVQKISISLHKVIFKQNEMPKSEGSTKINQPYLMRLLRNRGYWKVKLAIKKIPANAAAATKYDTPNKAVKSI